MRTIDWYRKFVESKGYSLEHRVGGNVYYVVTKRGAVVLVLVADESGNVPLDGVIIHG